MKSSFLIRANVRQSFEQLPNFTKRFVVSQAEGGAVFSCGAQGTSVFALICKGRRRPESDIDSFEFFHQIIVNVCRKCKAFCRRIGMDNFSMEVRISNKSDLRYETVENWEWMLRKSKQKRYRVARSRPGEHGFYLVFQVAQARFNFRLKRAKHTVGLCFFTIHVAAELLFDLIRTYPDCRKNCGDRSDSLYPSWPFKLFCWGNPVREQEYCGCGQANYIQSAKAPEVCDFGCHWGIVA